MTQWYKLACVFLTSLFVSTSLVAHGEGAVSRILINNVNIVDGKSEKLIPDTSVLIEGNKIAKIAGSVLAPDDAAVIDGGGITLTPGFIDAHVHLQWNVGPYEFVDIVSSW